MIKLTIQGNPLSKSNLKAFRNDGVAYTPKEGKYGKFFEYEQAIAWACANLKNKTLDTKCALVIKLFFKDRRHGDVHNYPKSICDGLEKGQIIKDDSLFNPVIIEGSIDSKNPRTEIEIYNLSEYEVIKEIVPISENSIPLHITIPGNPVSKSNFKLQSYSGKGWMPSKGKYSKYSEYETLVAWETRVAGRGRKILDEECILDLDLYFKSSHKRDVHNYPKSICDGIEKGNVITNDKLFKPIYISGQIDSKNPRAEIGIYPISQFEFKYSIKKRK